jgi:GNAT superfamily N-acetyltransferase
VAPSRRGRPALSTGGPGAHGAAADDLLVSVEASVDEALRAQVMAGLDAALPAGLPARVATPLGVLLRAPDGRLVGALTGHTRWGWLSIELLWVEAAARRGGHGRRLLAAAEQEAQRRGCRHVRVDTYSFQAPDFYERCGYRLVATLADFPHGHQRHLYAKALA